MGVFLRELIVGIALRSSQLGHFCRCPITVFVSNETLSHPATMVTTEEQNAAIAATAAKALNADWFCKTLETYRDCPGQMRRD
jgi:hypothetical protein